MKLWKHEFKIGRLKIKSEHRQTIMGRFGGGWDWIIGFRASKNFSTVILHFLVFDVRLALIPKEVSNG